MYNLEQNIREIKFYRPSKFLFNSLLVYFRIFNFRILSSHPVIGNPLIRGQRTIKIQKITHFLIPKIDTLRRAHSSIVLMYLIFNENT